MAESEVLDLSGFYILEFAVDFRVIVRLVSNGPEKYAFIMNGAFSLERDGKTLKLDAEARDRLEPIFAVFPADAQRIVRTGDGRCRLELTNGAAFVAEPGDQYESWEVHGPDGLMWIGTPGADVAIWTSRPQLPSELHPVNLFWFTKAVARLAAEPEQQIAYLKAIGTYPSTDELALEFDEGRRLLPQFAAKGWVTAETVEVAGKIDSLLSSMSGEANAPLWTPEALQSSNHWAAVRRFARDLIRLEK